MFEPSPTETHASQGCSGCYKLAERLERAQAKRAEMLGLLTRIVSDRTVYDELPITVIEEIRALQRGNPSPLLEGLKTLETVIPKLFAERADHLLRDMRYRLGRDPDVADFKGAFDDEIKRLRGAEGGRDADKN